MENLTVSRQSCRSLEALENEILDNFKYLKILCTINPNNDDLYIVLENQLYVIPSNPECEITSVNINNETKNKIIGLEYTNITQQVYCAYENGDLITISIESDLECELVKQINEGVDCMKLSPDHEILTLVTPKDTVITMVSSFDIISEVDLQESHFGNKQFVTIGWGKKETQFHGSIGKAAAIVQPVEINKNNFDDGLPRITWRGDGSMFAVSFIGKEKGIRQFKVFSREGILQYTSELLDNMEEPLAWKPSGNLIATTQILINKHVVSFFEKNGLKHREFLLPFETKTVSVKEIFWSPDSDILTIWCKQNNCNTTILQLWTEKNYHWYLKQTFYFSKDNPLLYGTWSSRTNCGKTLILLTPQNVLTYSFQRTINHSKGQSLQDKAVVAVIDGNKVLLTGFKIGIVPPPMAHQTLELSEPINAVVFAPNVKSTESLIDTNAFFCVLSNNKLAFFKCTNDSNNLEYKNISTCEMNWDAPTFDTKNVIPIMQHFSWFKENTILSSISIDNQSILCVINLDLENNQVTVKQTHIMDALIEHIICSPNTDDIFLIAEGSVLKYKDNELDLIGIKLPNFSSKVDLIHNGTSHAIISLSHGNRLSINSKEVANNVTSFFLHSKLLLLTTSQHTLICVTLDEEGLEQLSKQDLTTKPWENNMFQKSVNDVNIRRIERGSFLVIALPNNSKTILQAPRGNLECIQPRPLSLYIIGEHLKKCEYFSAFDLMRKQHINLNLIYDYEPQLFLKNAKKFVEDIANPQWLSLFLTELQNEDVTTTIYSNCYLKCKKQDASVAQNGNKVSMVCNLLKTILEEKHNADYFIQPILVSLVKNRDQQGLEGALKKLKEIKTLESTKFSHTISSEDALKYLLYLVDVNVLFDTALGMYDFELTMFIATKSQKDPKEYIPFLNNLKILEENFMKYSIDIYLKRYESALNHISKDTEKFDECLNLIRNHSMYKNGLKIFKKGSKEYKEVAQIYGEYLLSKNKLKEAAIMFHKANDYNNALNTYKLAGCWQEAIMVSTLLHLCPTESSALYEELKTRLCQDKRYLEAAQISALYIKDFEQVITTLCEGKYWKDALRIATDVNRSDLIVTHIQTGVQEHVDYITAQIIKNKEDLEKYKNRLTVIRTEMTNRQTQVCDDTLNDNILTTNKGFNDFLSDTSSVTNSITSHGSRTSTTSKRSYRSSKNRRKQERKLLSMKEGSMFEDLGIMRALHEIITKTYQQKDEVDLLTQMLLHFNCDEVAEELQDSMKKFLAIIESSKSKIWDKSAPISLSLYEADSIDNVVSKKSQETFVPQKLVESRIMYPPEEPISTKNLYIFSN
ncbi:putative elongator complex protein 1 isoform X1 [Polistes fuscatus]|uniref:putative elongator complex protein 1 isoform X1 n=1 Tax=Polistes fuscatus TaxID=30207 RepID=UPI001CA9359D|nr:putative elongator complex protein 1 isoform X1 [Polistes fuscatus]